MSRIYGLACAAALLVACSSDASYTVAGHTLTVKDSGYITTTAYDYCAAAAAGQMKINIVDYNPICGALIPATADGGARDPQLEHNELELIVITSVQDDPKLPFDVNVPNCDVGPAGPGIASFKHYASGSSMPDVTQAMSGQIFVSYVDPTGVKPATGKFSLDFGSAGQIDGTFETYTCN